MLSFSSSAPVSIGIVFGLSSSITTAYHSFLIKSSLPLVDDSALEMANYSNAGTALMLFPISLIAGEGPEILKIMTGQEPAGRLLIGILVTVSRRVYRQQLSPTLTPIVSPHRASLVSLSESQDFSRSRSPLPSPT